jgi:multiple sugar transport system permease protein
MLAGAVFFVFLFGPVYWMVVTSLMTESEMLAVPPHLVPHEPTLRNYMTILGLGDPDHLQRAQNRAPAVFDIAPALWNSLVTAVSVAFVNLLVATPAAYAFARLNFRAGLPVLMGYLAIRMIPPIMIVVPLFLIMRTLDLIDTRVSLVLVYCFFTVPFSIWILQSYFKAMPVELEDAALIDGCSLTGIFFRIVLPLSKPAIVAATILGFIASWNNFIGPLIVMRSVERYTFPLALRSVQSPVDTEWGALMAGSVVAVLPLLVIFVFSSRRLIAGLTAGAVKS